MKNKIKVIHLVDDLKIGGLERMLATIVTHLDKNRYEVMVGCLIGGGDIAEELIRKNIQVKILSFSKSPFLVLWRLIFWLRKEKPKIIHCWALSAGVLGRLAGFFVFVPVIILHVQNVYYGLSEKQRIIERILSFITHKIIACSEGVKESLVNFVKINKKKIEVIYNSIELDRFTVNYESPNLRKELRIEDNEIVIGTVSRLVPQKGIDILLEAAKELMSEFTQVKFLIVGDGYLRKDLETKAKLLRIEDKVIFTGLRKDIFLLLSIMDIFVQPSLKEGLPLSVLEAQATGVPVIAANVPGNNELIIHKETGLLVPPQDKEALRQSLSFLIKNYSLAKEMAQRAKEYCQQKFNAKIMIQQIDKLYSQLLK